VLALRPRYDPNRYLAEDEALAQVIQLIKRDHFSLFEPGLFAPIVARLLSPQEPWLVLADFAAYRAAQQEAAHRYRDAKGWWESSILNVARSGRFSSDRTICEYNEAVWRLTPLSVVANSDNEQSGR